MTVPWAVDDDQHTPNPETSPSSVSSSVVNDFVETIELCVIKFDFAPETDFLNFKPVVIVNDVFFNLHSKTIPDPDEASENGDTFSEKTSPHLNHHRKYTVFIIVVSFYVPAKLRFDNNDCILKVKTSGKHRKIMIKSSFVGLDGDGGTDELLEKLYRNKHWVFPL